jgi:adenylosuccinate lyase
MERIIAATQDIPVFGKFAGATGNYAAHMAAFPKKDWAKLSKEFVEKRLDLNWNGMTTQIESHDGQAAILNEISRLSSVIIDMCRDIWGYISLGYFGQKVVAGEVGSSTMPHKVNPIDFENAEGNLKLARGIARTLADELPISRWQRDLTDSTLQRNLGLVFGHFGLALASLMKGLGKLEIKKNVLKKDLQNAPEVLTEAVQTVLRAHGHADAYDQLKKFSRGQALTLPQVHEFIAQTKLPEADKKRLLELTPETYTGASESLVELLLK